MLNMASDGAGWFYACPNLCVIIYWRKGCSYKETNISLLWRGRVPSLFCLNAQESFVTWVSNPQCGTCGLPPESLPTWLPGVSRGACLAGGGGAAGVTHCFRRAGPPCSHTAPLRFPAHRFDWDSPPPHRDLQPLLLKRKTNRNTTWFSHQCTAACGHTLDSPLQWTWCGQMADAN